MTKKRLVLDGQEGACGRILLAISALHLAAQRLLPVYIDIIDVAHFDVEVAVEALVWDERLNVRTWGAEQSSRVLADADLYAAIAFTGVGHLRLEEAEGQGIATLVAVQFPGDMQPAPRPELVGAAHDPRRFAALLCDALGVAA